MDATESPADEWRDLVDRVAAHGVRYLMGSSDWEGSTSPYVVPEDAPLDALLLDLAGAPEARLRDALVALFLRHPEYSPAGELTARRLAAGDQSRGLLFVSIIVAAALQCEWGFSLDLYLPDRLRINADHLVAELGLPSPSADFGRLCLAASAALLRIDDPFPFNYEAAWEDVARRLLDQLAREARERGA